MPARTTLFLGNFFIAVSSTLVSYTLISYLLTFIPATLIGFTIAIGAAFALTLFFFLPRFVARTGAQWLTLASVFTMMIMLFAVAAAPSTIASAILVVLVISLQPILYYGLDLLLEATVDSAGMTGRARTLFLTGGNLGSLVAPLLIGTLLAATESYTFVFFTAAAVLVPFIVIFSLRKLPRGTTPHPAHVHDTIRHLLHDRDLAAVTIGHLILYLFYMWAPLYVPVYLHGVLGLPWSELGWVFSIMLVPYVLIEYPAGWVADRILGDKEMMLVGFILAGFSLASVGLITAHSSILMIVTILLATRAGAALIESMTEGHFFRRVSEQDIVSVSVFRGVWPLANIIAPLAGTLILFCSHSNYPLFFVLTGGFVMIAGTIATLRIKDFR